MSILPLYACSCRSFNLQYSVTDFDGFIKNFEDNVYQLGVTMKAVALES